MELERQARNRRPPGYLADYHVGPVDLAPQGQNSPSTGSNPHSYGPRYPPRDTTIEFTYRRSADSDRVELPYRSSSWNMTEHVDSARASSPTRRSAFLTPVTESTARTLPNSDSNSNLYSSLLEMGNPLTDLTTSQDRSGMSIRSEPPVSEYDHIFDFNIAVETTSINRVDTTLVEELSVDLGALATLDEFYDSETGLANLLGSPKPKVIKAPYKEGPKIGHTQIDQSRSMSTVAEDAMDTGAEELDLLNSPSTRNPGSAPGSPKGSPSRGQSVPAVSEEPAEPVEVLFSKGEASVILSGGAVHTDTGRPGRSKLALPKVLTDRQYWITQQTKINIEETCGLPGNLKCRQCGKRFTTARRLRVHAPQHYTNVFCPCGEYSFQRDYISRHQRIARCHTGRTFVVDATMFPEFRDLILPHVGNPRRQAVLARGFPACRPVREDSDGEDAPGPDQPATTQPLRVVLDRMTSDESATTRRSPQRARPSTKQHSSRRSPTHSTNRQPFYSTSSRLSTTTSHSSSTDRHVSPHRPATTHRPAPPTRNQPVHICPHEGEIRRLRRRLRQCEEDIQAIRRQLSR